MVEAETFIASLGKGQRRKVLYNLKKASLYKDSELLKKLSGQIWEFRTFYSGQKIRLFAFWDKSHPIETLIICTHGYIKKTKKISPKEIIKAEQLRLKYFKYKNEQED